MGTPQLNGLSGYGEMWLWLAGDDRMLPAPGLELPNRTERTLHGAPSRTG